MVSEHMNWGLEHQECHLHASTSVPEDSAGVESCHSNPFGTFSGNNVDNARPNLTISALNPPRSTDISFTALNATLVEGSLFLGSRHGDAIHHKENIVTTTAADI